MSDRASIEIDPVGAKRTLANDASRERNLWTRVEASLTVQNAKTFAYFLIWFILSVVYNICNKKAHHATKLPLFLAAFQMFTGIPIILFLWATGLRKAPSLWTRQLLISLSFMALFHSATHIGGVMSMGKGAVSFTHIIKASEPVFTAALSVVVLGQIYSWQVYLALVMVCVGCSIASIAEMDFNFLALLFALVSSLGASLRGTFSKEALKSVPAERNLQAQNLYYVLTILSSIICGVGFAVFEGPQFGTHLAQGLQKYGHEFLWFNLIISGLAYYLYNEVAFLALEAVSPVTHAIGSTFKRVFIIGASIIVLQNPVNGWGYTGCVIAIVSVFVYSLAKIRYPGRTIKKPFSSTPITKC